ncbi:unnamed protein product, partial [Ectocarpus sp. 13 AM-2016]
RWSSRDYIESPTSIYITSVKVSDLDLLHGAVQIATIVPSPTVEASPTKVYMQTTPT